MSDLNAHTICVGFSLISLFHRSQVGIGNELPASLNLKPDGQPLMIPGGNPFTAMTSSGALTLKVTTMTGPLQVVLKLLSL